MKAWHNDIAAALRELGYVAFDDDMECDWPVPELTLTGNNCFTVDDESFLDQFWDDGPRKGRKANATSIRRPPMKDRNKIGAASGWKCFYCNMPGTDELGPDNRVWHVDHVYPVAFGGDNKPDNLVLSCATCNLEKKARTASEYFRTRSLLPVAMPKEGAGFYGESDLLPMESESIQ